MWEKVGADPPTTSKMGTNFLIALAASVTIFRKKFRLWMKWHQFECFLSLFLYEKNLKKMVIFFWKIVTLSAKGVKITPFY